jgi:hypothetical protein
MVYGTHAVAEGYTPDEVWNQLVNHSVQTGNETDLYEGSAWFGSIYTLDNCQVLRGGDNFTVFSDRKGRRSFEATLDDLGIRDMLDVRFEPSRFSRILSGLSRLMPPAGVTVA